jgi:iron complex transport system substrate-binding protein
MERDSQSAATGSGSRWAWSLFPILFLLLACNPDAERQQTDVEGPRVVSLVPSLTELINALGAGQHLVARTDFDTHPGVLDLPTIGGGLDPSLERMVELGIDVVLMPAGRDAPALGGRLRELGMTVHTVPTNTISDLYEAIGRLGGLFQRPLVADSLNNAIREDVAEIQARVRDRRPVPVMYVVGPNPPMTTGGGTFIDHMIQIAGGRNVFGDSPLQWPTVGFEAIVDRDPEVVIWPQGEFTVENLDVLRSAPGWQDVPAVDAGRVVFVDGNLFNRPGPGFPEAARLLAAALHPEAFPPPGRPRS